jgi:hypothetical protein
MWRCLRLLVARPSSPIHGGGSEECATMIPRPHEPSLLESQARAVMARRGHRLLRLNCTLRPSHWPSSMRSLYSMASLRPPPPTILVVYTLPPGSPPPPPWASAVVWERWKWVRCSLLATIAPFQGRKDTTSFNACASLMAVQSSKVAPVKGQGH